MKCCAKLCKNCYYVGVDKSFYKFPSEEAQFLVWAERSGRLDLINSGPILSAPKPHHRLCSDHFEKNCFIKLGSKYLLKKGSLPFNYFKLKVNCIPRGISTPIQIPPSSLRNNEQINLIEDNLGSEEVETMDITIRESVIQSDDGASTVSCFGLSEWPFDQVNIFLSPKTPPAISKIMIVSESKYSGETAQKPSKANEHKVETGVGKQGCNGSVLTCEHLIAFIEERAKCYKLERVKEELNTEIECLKEEIEVLKKLKSEVNSPFPDLLQVKIEDVDSGSS